MGIKQTFTAQIMHPLPPGIDVLVRNDKSGPQLIVTASDSSGIAAKNSLIAFCDDLNAAVQA